MADLVRALLILRALVVSLRARYVAGVVIALLSACVVGIEVFVAFRFPPRTGGVEVALGAVFLGPSAMPHTPPLPATRLLMDPTHHLLAAGLAAVGARRAFGRSRALPPDTVPARRLDRAGLAFVALAVFAALFAISGVVMHVLGD